MGCLQHGHHHRLLRSEHNCQEGKQNFVPLMFQTELKMNDFPNLLSFTLLFSRQIATFIDGQKKGP
jgi:hypothetical protein